ncbi:ankyrin repeat domain-containing protein [Parashewanella curva]|uniref:Ankyrin repeat domain-containing protein n=1 Tax=Parashewanella curva TaxID=2338552 RepID=A0A3L8PV07_9GAMM|nr:ankyrin repeat domain-containing protein [Parashewanella curva]RLV58258.1 ankyrin repeat domain-containing protein [Parashewanella curva]
MNSSNVNVQNAGGLGLQAIHNSLANSQVTVCQGGSAEFRNNSAANSHIKVQDRGRALFTGNAADGATIIASGASVVVLDEYTASPNLTLCHNAKVVNLSGHDIFNELSFEKKVIVGSNQALDKNCQPILPPLPTTSLPTPSATAIKANPTVKPSVASEVPPTAEAVNVGGIVAGVVVLSGVTITVLAATGAIICYVKREAIAEMIERFRERGVEINEQQAKEVIEGVAINIAKQTHPEVFESQQSSEQQGAAVKTKPAQKTVTISLKQLEEGLSEVCKIAEDAAGKASEEVGEIMRQAAHDLNVKPTAYSEPVVQEDKSFTGVEPLPAAEVTAKTEVVRSIKGLTNKHASDLLSACANGKLSELQRLIKSLPSEFNVRLLLQHAPTGDWVSLLHIASAAGKSDIVEYLIGLNANVNSVSRNEFTPLYLAVWNKRAEVVKQLLKANADINRKTNGKTPLELAEEQNDDAITALLKNKQPQSHSHKDSHLGKRK